MDIFLGDTRTHLLIFTGIGIPNFGSVDGPNRDTARVRLGRPVIQLPGNGEWSATVGLASIGNTESDFIFATDKVGIDLDPDGILVLMCDLAVQGDKSGLNRFSYQLNVIVEVIETELESLLVSDLEPSAGFGKPPGPPVYGPRVFATTGKPWGGGRVTLTLPAPSPGVWVKVESSNPSIVGFQTSAPQLWVPVPAGTKTTDFTGGLAGFVTGNTDVTLTASLKSVQKTAVLTVRPEVR